jgi:hypothetical protein
VKRLEASSTDCDQISFGIVANCAAPFYVVDIEIREASTHLTAPVVTSQNFLAQLRISRRTVEHHLETPEPEARLNGVLRAVYGERGA